MTIAQDASPEAAVALPLGERFIEWRESLDAYVRPESVAFNLAVGAGE